MGMEVVPDKEATEKNLKRIGNIFALFIIAFASALWWQKPVMQGDKFTEIEKAQTNIVAPKAADKE